MNMRIFSALSVLLVAGAVSAGEAPAPAPNGITLPEGYKDWRVIGVSHRTDNDTLRVILGNDTAVAGGRDGGVIAEDHAQGIVVGTV